nr:MAG TPA: hypothetical protein [Caudoviricetes sp.]
MCRISIEGERKPKDFFGIQMLFPYFPWGYIMCAILRLNSLNHIL